MKKSDTLKNSELIYNYLIKHGNETPEVTKQKKYEFAVNNETKIKISIKTIISNIELLQTKSDNLINNFDIEFKNYDNNFLTNNTMQLEKEIYKLKYLLENRKIYLDVINKAIQTGLINNEKPFKDLDSFIQRKMKEIGIEKFKIRVSEERYKLAGQEFKNDEVYRPLNIYL
ncbi:MAG: hypothetical protein ACOCP8_02760 [archaeon]